MKNNEETCTPDSAHHQNLREEIQEKLNTQVVTTRFFVLCASDIYKQTHAHMSVSTLKRYWHYVHTPEDYKPNPYTLDILARYAGYKDWATYCKHKEHTAETYVQPKDYDHLQASLDRIEQRITDLQGCMEELRQTLVKD